MGGGFSIFFWGGGGKWGFGAEEEDIGRDMTNTKLISENWCDSYRASDESPYRSLAGNTWWVYGSIMRRMGRRCRGRRYVSSLSFATN